MTVPDRILVAGQEKHVGAKAPPRELQLERAVMPPESEVVRVQVGMVRNPVFGDNYSTSLCY
jgi:hypothetical protein